GFLESRREFGVDVCDPVGQHAPAEAEGIVLTGGVYLGDDYAVGGGEGAGEVVHEVTGAGVCVWLENRDDTMAGEALARRQEGGLYLGWVVGIVVYDCHAVCHA